MKILVANLGSTSFKYCLFDMSDERQLARGGIERIGAAESPCVAQIGDRRIERTAHIPDHAAAVRLCLEQLTDAESGCLSDAREVAAIGFKAVHGGRISGVQRVTPDVLAAMQEMSDVAPAHNPPYIAAMRLLSEKLEGIPLVAAFETAFHATVPDRLRRYAVPHEWAKDYSVQRWGFHGASHRYIAQRIAELMNRDDLRVVSLHLGGSSSLCAISCGKSAATSMGMSPQSGVPQNNRVGDFDPYALRHVIERTGKTIDEVLDVLATQSGLLGISGVSGDVRDLEEAAAAGNSRARLALDVYTSDVRRYLGAMLVELGGAEVLVFTGGIGENGVGIRSTVCAGLTELGIELDEAKNAVAKGETAIHSSTSRAAIWVVPTNEEIVVARQARELLHKQSEK